MARIHVYYVKNSLQWLLGKNLNVVINNKETIIAKARDVVTKNVNSGEVNIQMSTPYFGSEIGKANTKFNIADDEDIFVTYKSPFFVFSSGTIFVEKGTEPNPEIVNKNEVLGTLFKLFCFMFMIILIFGLIWSLIISNIFSRAFTISNNSNGNINSSNEESNVSEGNKTNDENNSINNPNQNTETNLTVSQQNAVEQANNYLRIMGFSKSGLIQQLEYEGYPHDDAAIALESMNIDWIHQASVKANSYISMMGYSRSGLIEQLEFEGFLHDEAVSGVDSLTIDWEEQATRKAKQYLDIMAYSRSGLIDQLEFEGFTHDQAVYAADENGY